MKNIITALLIAAASVSLTACGSTSIANENYESVASKFATGKSTKADVRAKLGEPKQVAKDGKNEVWSYVYSSAGNFIGVGEIKELTMTFSPRGVLISQEMSRYK
jgi:outer membrane protein assembly factor BamE (lipoprotein component of BamABCDE complex)